MFIVSVIPIHNFSNSSYKHSEFSCINSLTQNQRITPLHVYYPFVNFEQKSLPCPCSHYHHLYLPITIMAIGIAINSPIKIVQPTKIKRKTMKQRANLLKTLFFQCCDLFTLTVASNAVVFRGLVFHLLPITTPVWQGTVFLSQTKLLTSNLLNS